MKISLNWLKELVELDLSPKDLVDKLSLVSIGVKEQTEDFLELDLTYNRGDLLSLRGVAREVAALTASRILFPAPDTKDYQWEGKDLPRSPAEVKNQDLCPVYCIAKIENLKVAPPPIEWVNKLKSCGVRSINNVADITNLIMLEYGQPMHSFDEAEVKDGTIIVRTACKGEELITLDGKKRILDETDLLIADPEKALGLAGIMGGKNSEITEKTTTILLEAAIFDPTSNRKSSKKHGLYSEATKRFQHGLTKTNLLQAFDAAIKMYEGLGGKLTAISLSGNLKDETKTINLTKEKINSLIGIEIKPEEVESSLQKLGFKLASHSSSGNVNWEVTVPYWRLDINIEEDLIEEVARMYGYEKIASKALEGKFPEELNQDLPDLVYNMKQSLAKAGLTEVQTYSFYSSQVIEGLELQTENLIRIANPISSETEYLRDQLWPSLLETVAKNIKQGYKDIAVFEIEKVYLLQKGDLPEENYHLSIALSNGTDNPLAELNQIAKSLSLHPARGLITQEGVKLNLQYFHPTRYTDDMAEIHPRIVNKFGIEQRVAVLETEIIAPL